MLRTRTDAPPAVGLLAGAGSAVALFATYWDDSWHTDRGRDDFGIPPHLLLYGGVLAALLAILLWAHGAWRAAGSGVVGARSLIADPALRLAAVGATTTLLSAPVDDAWHRTFGRDAVLWSPPHLAAVAGTLALSVGLLAGLRSSRGRAAPIARLLAAAGVIGTLQVPVLEYDSDVPQFSVFWYLPVAALGICIAAVILEDLLPRRTDLVWAAFIYTVLRAFTVVLLESLDFSLTIVPPVVLLFVLLAAMQRWSQWLRIVVLGAVTPLVWWPFVEVQGEAAEIAARDLASAVAVAVVGSAMVVVLHRVTLPAPSCRHLQAAAAALILLAAVTAPAKAAFAHDPGQGPSERAAALALTRDGDVARLTVHLDVPCEGFTPERTVARRAGEVRAGRLLISPGPMDACLLQGTVDGLDDDGRWFVYAELRNPSGQRVESWLPVTDDGTVRATRPLYTPPLQSAGLPRTAATALLLLVVAALTVSCLRIGGRPRPVSIAFNQSRRTGAVDQLGS